MQEALHGHASSAWTRRHAFSYKCVTFLFLKGIKRLLAGRFVRIRKERAGERFIYKCFESSCNIASLTELAKA